MNRPLHRAILVGGYLLGASTLQAESLYDNGPPDRTNGFETTHWVEADDFTLATGARLESVKFWSFEGSSSFEGSVVWQILSNGENDTPGAPIAGGTSTNVSHISTGFVFSGYAEFTTTFDIPPLALPPGVYWLALHNGPLTNDTVLGRVYWQTTGSLGTRPSHLRVAPFTGLWSSNAYPAGSLADCAFQISGILGPQIAAFGLGSGAPKISFTTTAGQTYRVEYKSSLNESVWMPLPGAAMVAGTGAIVQVADTDPNVATQLRRFYRVVLL